MYNKPILFANLEIKSNGNQNKGNVFECIVCHGYFSQIYHVKCFIPVTDDQFYYPIFASFGG